MARFLVFEVLSGGGGKVHGGAVGTYSHMQVQVLEVRIDGVTAVTHQCIS
jgi:hypothetical protein